MEEIKEIIYVYITKNIVNNKQYVGMHSTFNVDDGYLGSGRCLIKAFKKYGKENFKREIICFCISLDEAYKKESEYIKIYDTLNPKGYNLSPTGGNNVKGSMSEESKKKLSNSISGEKHWSYGKKQSKEVIEKRRKALMGHKGCIHTQESINKILETKTRNNSFKHTEETKIKIGLASKNRIVTDETKEKLRQAALKQWDRQLNRIVD